MKSLITTGLPQLLVTDDDPALRQAVAEGLGRRGFEVTQARNGREAIELVGRSSVHVALIDLHMPEVNGLELIRYLNRQPQSPLCLLMSADLDDSIRREAASLNTYRVLDKPFRLEPLAKLIREGLTDLHRRRFS